MTTGFEIVARRPMLIVIPLLLDLFLWLGPRLSLAPIFQEYNQMVAQVPDLELMEAYALFQSIAAEVSARFNLFAALIPGPFLGLPSLMAGQMTLERPFGIRPEMLVGSSGLALFYAALLSVIGMGINAVYLRLVGNSIIDETEIPLPGPGNPAHIWGNLIQFALILMGLLFVAGLPLLCLVGVLSMIAPSIAMFVMMMLSSLILFVGFHLLFVIPGIVQLRRLPLHAIRDSILITRTDFMGSVGLLITIAVVSQGLSFVWTLPEPTSWATVIGLGGHAFIGSALTAALFVFYQERLSFLEILNQAYVPKPAPVDPLG